MTKILVVCGGAGRGLLGQREALGFAAELQLDVQKEILPAQNDQLAWRLHLDKAVLATNSLLTEMYDRWGSDISKPVGRHTAILYQGFPVQNNLDTGLGQSPAIGGGVIRNPNNEKMLRTTVTQMVQKVGQTLGQDNQLDVWIVSSTAGGTGAGVRRFVAKVIAEEVGRQYQNCVVKLHFLLYGARTYNSVNAHQTALNTFLSVAQDAAFVHTRFDMTNQPVRFFYYLEIPDVGRGTRAREERERLVEVTARAVFLDELRPVFEVVANNTPNKTVFVRVGFWGGELPRDQLYYETLRQLTKKLGDLTQPQPAQFINRFSCRFESSDLDRVKEAINGQLVVDLASRGWKFPSRGGVFNRKSDADLVAEAEDAVAELLKLAKPSFQLAQLSGTFLPVSKVGVERQPVDGGGEQLDPGQADTLTRPLAVAKPSASIDWSAKQDLILDAHRVVAWCEKLLFHPDESVPLDQQRKDAASRCADIFAKPFTATTDKANKLYAELYKFVELTVKQRLLQELLNRANAQLAEQQVIFLRVKVEADKQLEIMRQQGVASESTNLVLASELSQPVSVTNHRAWIEMLDRALQSHRDDHFRKTVEAGAVGLTLSGLARVLGVRGEDSDAIRAEVMNNAGGMIINGEKTQGIWWQANGNIWNSGDDRYQYRIFPDMSELDWAALRGQTTGSVEFLRTKMGAIGLRVLAMDIVNIGKNDLSAAAEALVKDLKSHLETELQAWPDDNSPVKNRVTTGVLHIASSGVGGEPLDRVVLERLKFANDQLKNLAYLYELQKPTEAPGPAAETQPPVPLSVSTDGG